MFWEADWSRAMSEAVVEAEVMAEDGQEVLTEDNGPTSLHFRR